MSVASQVVLLVVGIVALLALSAATQRAAADLATASGVAPDQP